MCSKKCAFPKATYTGELEDLILVFFLFIYINSPSLLLAKGWPFATIVSEETYTMLSILLFLTGSVLHVTVLSVLHFFFFMMSEIYIYIELLTRCLLFAEVCI